MHHSISYYLARARLAGLRRHGQRATLARAVLVSALRRCAGSVPFLASSRSLSPPRLATRPLAKAAPAAA
jgi:hypothetical protein